MSAKGHKQKWWHARVMSVLPPKADIRQREWHVRYANSGHRGLSGHRYVELSSKI
jgi:hypothetical protein